MITLFKTNSTMMLNRRDKDVFLEVMSDRPRQVRLPEGKKKLLVSI